MEGRNYSFNASLIWSTGHQSIGYIDADRCFFFLYEIHGANVKAGI
jgi:hypothetical protein